MSGFSGIETNNDLEKLKLDMERGMLSIVYKSYKNGYEEGVLKNAPRVMENVPVAPVPCHIEDSTTIKDFFQKMNEELDELKQEVFQFGNLNDEIGDSAYILKGGDSYTLEDADLDKEDRMRIAEEAADLITAATSLMEALGIGFKERNEAQRRVNEHNHERGRN